MIKLLDCTLRDGGYINDWLFGQRNITRIVNGLTDAGVDVVEIGYLNKDVFNTEKSIFKTIEDTRRCIPKKRKNTMYVAMADAGRFLPENISPYRKGVIDGIRVAFYKHQIEDALILCEKIVNMGYKLFLQPMVTAEYSADEYNCMLNKMIGLKPYCVSIVDSFGYMTSEQVKFYFDLLDSKLSQDCMIGFHAHNNMGLAFLNSQAVFDYDTKRTVVIDSSLCGMGRTAGNLNTELIAKYYNENIESKYRVQIINDLISDIIHPIYKEKSWGYSPYYFLTANYRCHPNYSTFILAENDVSINEFEEFLKTIPDEYRIKCRKQKAQELFDEFRKNKKLQNKK